MLTAIHEQSDDINRGVSREEDDNQGAGDQGMMFGYATPETENYMPVSLDLAPVSYTHLQAVLKLFSMGCHLVIRGCNTASAKALRSLQQRDIPELDPSRRVLGIIRPTAEVIEMCIRDRS